MATNSEAQKECRHCFERIDKRARVCKHCRSHQGWASGQGDSRQLAQVFPFVILVLGISFGGVLFMKAEAKRSRMPEPPTCQGKLVVNRTLHGEVTTPHVERLWVRAEVTNTSTAAASDLVLRVEAHAPDGSLVETYLERLYGANLEAGATSWFQAVGYLTAGPTKYSSVAVTIESARCASAWD